MAESTSTSTSTASISCHDVFISHRGPDVKKSFASHLYRRLLSYGLRVFLDQPELQRGDYFTHQIDDAIRSASVHVAIFSSGYADSKWCLDELVQMLDSKAPIIPVFYGVKPTELRRTLGKKKSYAETRRWPTKLLYAALDSFKELLRRTLHKVEPRGKKRSYAEALEGLEEKTEYDPQTDKKKLRYDSSTIENWRNALSRVADISGIELEANGDEGELVDKIVEWVLKKVKKPALDVAKYPTGLEDKVKDFENSVLFQQQRRGKPRIFGIVGLGGVGKTTLAKELFNREKSKSNHHKFCFLSDVRDNAGKGCLISLQNRLLESLTGGNAVNSVDEGIGMLKMRLSSTNALVIIDDVDDVDQVYALWPSQTVLHSDSLIVITSRNKDVLKAVFKSSGVEESSIYNLTGLTKQHSLQLFCLHSFNRPHPPPEFESLVNKFLKACAGLPLSLKVIGALLNGKDTSYWEDQLNRLERILPNEIKQKLQISYDALECDEKQIFLDIACFFIGEDRDMAVRIWDNGLCGFRNIQDRCLVEVNNKKKIKMHDHLRDMGREIAKASGLPRRLWRCTEDDIDDLLQQSLVTPVRGIRMALSENNEIDDAFGGITMRRMQLLDTESVLVEHILTKVKSPDLTWLRWKTCPHSSLPSWIPMKSLRVLQVQGKKLETLWKEDSQAPSQLRELIINAPLKKIPKSIGQLKHLERIEIHSAPLTELPAEFCLLQSLKSLVLDRCKEMKSLPECFGNLTNLHRIELKNCSALERLPECFGKSLRVLQVEGKKLETLWKEDSQAPSQLRELIIDAPLKKIPKSIGQLKHLERIEIHSVPLTELPAEFCLLQSLKSLVLDRCTEMKSLPECFGNLTNLHHIDLNRCFALERLPDSFGRLIKLQDLRLAFCRNLTMSSETLGNISTLKYLDLDHCGKIEVLPQQVAHQMSLEQLFLGGTNLKEIPSAIGELSFLEHLRVGSPFLDTLPPSLCDLKNLKTLSVVGWGLECLPASLELLTQLTYLRVSECPCISELPFKKAVKGDRETLSDLNSSIHNCIFPRLQELSVYLTGISEVSFAQGVCFNLRYLEILQCDKLVEVGTLPNTLLNLTIWECRNLRKIGNMDGLAELRLLDVSECSKLEELPGIETLVSLTRLQASGCVKLKSIRGLRQLTELQRVIVKGCSDLEEVEGIHHCMSLKELDVQGCTKLRWSAGVEEQLRQRRVVLLRTEMDLICKLMNNSLRFYKR